MTGPIGVAFFPYARGVCLVRGNVSRRGSHGPGGIPRDLPSLRPTMAPCRVALRRGASRTVLSTARNPNRIPGDPRRSGHPGPPSSRAPPKGVSCSRRTPIALAGPTETLFPRGGCPPGRGGPLASGGAARLAGTARCPSGSATPVSAPAPSISAIPPTGSRLKNRSRIRIDRHDETSQNDSRTFGTV